MPCILSEFAAFSHVFIKSSTTEASGSTRLPSVGCSLTAAFLQSNLARFLSQISAPVHSFVRLVLMSHHFSADVELVQDVLHRRLVDEHIRQLARMKLDGRRFPWRKVAVVGGTGLASYGLAAYVLPLAGLKALGFTTAGITSGSWAALWQPSAIASGSWFAWAQSAAMTGAPFAKVGTASAATSMVGVSKKVRDMGDEEMLMTLIKKGLFDHEIRKVLIQKLQFRARM